MNQNASTVSCGCDAGANYYCEQHRPSVWDIADAINEAENVGPHISVDEATQRLAEAFTIKDSGERHQFASGSLRDTAEGKVEYSNVLHGPMFQRWAEHLTKAKAKYPDVTLGVPNWTLISTEKELLRYRESALRHFLQWFRGDTDEDHASATFFNINGVEYLKARLK